MKIFIDAGHGGEQPGAINSCSKQMEKDATLQIALKLQKALLAAGFDVGMSREDDTHVTLQDRVKMANKSGATAFISIHLNSAAGNAGLCAEGLETWIYASAPARTRELAKQVHESLINATKARNRGIKFSESFTVCKRTIMPAIMVECGFISNSKECAKCFDSTYQDKLITGFIDGLSSWKKWIL